MAPRAGINILTEVGGIIADDFDNDGLPDIVTSQVDDCAPLRFFHNNGNGTFSDRIKLAGLTGQFDGLNIIQADYNDGRVDILVLRGAWEFPRRLSLLRNDCDDRVTDVTIQSGLGRTPTSTQAAVWTDIDNDGNLNLFIANENGPGQLYLNKGDGTFVNIAHEAGVDRTAFSKAAIAADYPPTRLASPIFCCGMITGNLLSTSAPHPERERWKRDTALPSLISETPGTKTLRS